MSLAPAPLAVSGKSATVLIPPLLFVTTFASVSDAGWSLLLIVHVAFCPVANVIWLPPATVKPGQLQALAVYPLGPPLSESVYVPGSTGALVTAADPVVPEIGVGPEALSVHAV